MRRGRIFVFVAAIVVAIVTVSVFMRVVSGGEKTFLAVAAALETNSFVVGKVGSPVTIVEQNGGPWRVSLGEGGHRSGFYSVIVTGPNGKEPLKAYWREAVDGRFEVDAIYKTELFTQDQLLWGAPGRK